MFYFIPAWYNQQRPWYDITQQWYRGSIFGQFDDIINHIKMFESAKQNSQLLVLNYMPNLRYFTHQYDLLETSNWSLFDTIQDIGKINPRILDYRTFNWPKGTEFIFSPFTITANVAGEKLAIIDFGDDGQLIWVTTFNAGQVEERLIFDDRGFLSSILYFKQGREHYQEYFNTAGEWQIREYLLEEDCHIEVAPDQYHRFSQKSYTNMEELVREKVSEYLAKLDTSENCLVIAAHTQHNSLLLEVKGQKKVILSYYQDRIDLAQRFSVVADMSQSDIIIADTIATTDLLRNYQAGNIEHISPFDARLSLGKSQRRKELQTYILLDGLRDDQIESQLTTWFMAMENDENIVLKLVTYDNNQVERERKEALIAELMEKDGAPYLFFESEDELAMFELVEEESVSSRVSMEYLASELAIQQSLEYVRLIVDLGDHPDLYTQIAGISAGIPQVNSKSSEFVEHLKNGYILTDETELMKAVDYYFSGLSNWNQALIYAVQKIEDYTSGRLVHRLMSKLT